MRHENHENECKINGVGIKLLLELLCANSGKNGSTQRTSDTGTGDPNIVWVKYGFG